MVNNQPAGLNVTIRNTRMFKFDFILELLSHPGDIISIIVTQHHRLIAQHGTSRLTKQIEYRQPAARLGEQNVSFEDVVDQTFDTIIDILD